MLKIDEPKLSSSRVQCAGSSNALLAYYNSFERLRWRSSLSVPLSDRWIPSRWKAASSTVPFMKVKLTSLSTNKTSWSTHVDLTFVLRSPSVLSSGCSSKEWCCFFSRTASLTSLFEVPFPFRRWWGPSSRLPSSCWLELVNFSTRWCAGPNADNVFPILPTHSGCIHDWHRWHCTSPLGDFPECRQFLTQYLQLSPFFPFYAVRRPFIVGICSLTSLESSMVGTWTVTAGEEPLLHASLVTWHVSLSMRGRV